MTWNFFHAMVLFLCYGSFAVIQKFFHVIKLYPWYWTLSMVWKCFHNLKLFSCYVTFFMFSNSLHDITLFPWRETFPMILKFFHDKELLSMTASKGCRFIYYFVLSSNSSSCKSWLFIRRIFLLSSQWIIDIFKVFLTL